MGIILIVIAISFAVGFVVAALLSENEKMTGEEFMINQQKNSHLSNIDRYEMESIIREEGLWDKKAKFRIVKEIKHVLIIDKDSYIEKKIGL